MSTSQQGDRPTPLERKAAREQALAQAPYVVVNLQTTGIHPTTARVVAIDAITYSPELEPVEKYHTVINPGEAIGPVHLHGLREKETGQAPRFGTVLRQVCRLIDGRTLIVHDAPTTWGFLVSESRRALRNAARGSNRGRQRGRGSRGGRGRSKRAHGHIPKPEIIVDTLASARRQEVAVPDERIRGAAQALGLAAAPAATAQRALQSEEVTSREETVLVMEMYRRLRPGPLATCTPGSVRADRAGLQRSIVRVDAAEGSAKGAAENPGVFVDRLRPGMIFSVAPEIAADPDEVIQAGVDAGLVYVEKLTRDTSVVVCNQRENLVAKPMHAQRKAIPLMRDEDFLVLAARCAAQQRDQADRGGSASYSSAASGTSAGGAQPAAKHNADGAAAQNSGGAGKQNSGRGSGRSGGAASGGTNSGGRRGGSRGRRRGKGGRRRGAGSGKNSKKN